MITLYQFEISPFCDKIRRIMNLKKVPYKLHEVTIFATTLGYKKVNPIGKVPCIEDDGKYIADSTDIAYYLDEKFPEPRVIPQSPGDRALCHMIEDWADESLYFYEMRLRFTFPNNAKRWVPILLKHDAGVMQAVAPPMVVRSVTATAKAQGVGRKPDDMVLRDIERHLTAIGDWLGDRSYLVGSSLTLADIGVFAQLHCIRETDEGTRLFASYPKIAAWMERIDKQTSSAAGVSA